MTYKPLVSVIIPCYKQAHFLPKAVESVCQQSYSNWECLIVNDGSPDNTSEAARNLIKQYSDKQIVLLKKANGGLSSARNHGIRNSKGKYILPLDADDKIHPDMIRKMVYCLEADPAISIAYSDEILFGNEDQIKRTGRFDKKKLPLSNLMFYCALYRREVWEKTGGYNLNMKWGYEDWDFWLSCIEKGLKAKKVPECLFYYRSKENSMFMTAFNNHDIELKKQIIKNHPDIYNKKIIFIKKKILRNSQKFNLKILFSPWLQKILLSGKIKDANDCYKIAQALFEVKDYKNSRIWLKKASSGNKLSLHAMYGIASIYKKLNELEIATKIFIKLIRVRNKKIKSGAYFHLGEIAYYNKKGNDAISCFKKCLDVNPEHGKAREYVLSLGKNHE